MLLAKTNHFSPSCLYQLSSVFFIPFIQSGKTEKGKKHIIADIIDLLATGV